MDKEAVLAFFAGAALGAIGAAVWTGKRFKKEVDKICDEYDEYVDKIVEEMKQHCADCQVTNSEDIVDDEEVDNAGFEECDAEDYDREALIEHLNSMANLESKRDENGIIPYDKIAKKTNQSDESADEKPSEDEVKAEEEVERVQDNYLEEDELEEPTIHYISQDEYENTQDDFDKIELTYLDGSDVFLTDEDEKYNAYPAIGGRGNLEEAFSESPNGIVYIRNDMLEMDFRIVSDVRDYDTYMKETSKKNN